MKKQQVTSPERRAELKAMSHADYLKTDEWRRLRFLTLRIAGDRCQVCNAPGPGLQVHHRTYEHFGEERPGRDLTVLCSACHALFSRHGRLVRSEKQADGTIQAAAV